MLDVKDGCSPPLVFCVHSICMQEGFQSACRYELDGGNNSMLAEMVEGNVTTIYTRHDVCRDTTRKRKVEKKSVLKFDAPLPC